MSTTGGTKHPSGPIPLWLVIGWGCIVFGLTVWWLTSSYEKWARLHQDGRHRLVYPIPATEAA